MSELRILHVDDEADIREVVAIALSLDPDLVSRSCASGQEALAIAEAWKPDVLLLDVMMPAMDGPTTLARLREGPATAGIPVLFMTARAQSSELKHFGSLGAVGVIPKPFDPMTLAVSVKAHIDRIAAMRSEFQQRVENDLVKLWDHWRQAQGLLQGDEQMSAMKSVAHGLAGAGGIFGFDEISQAAAKLERAILDERNGSGTLADVGVALAALQNSERQSSYVDQMMEPISD